MEDETLTYECRVEALRQANTGSWQHDTSDNIVKRAAVFEDYLTNGLTEQNASQQ